MSRKNEMQTVTNESNCMADESHNYKNNRGKKGAEPNILGNGFLTGYCKAKGKRN